MTFLEFVKNYNSSIGLSKSQEQLASLVSDRIEHGEHPRVVVCKGFRNGKSYLANLMSQYYARS
jgi:hypothetical protein